MLRTGLLMGWAMLRTGVVMLLILLAAGRAAAAEPACDGRREALIAQAYPRLGEAGALPARPGWTVDATRAVCKRWPAHPDRILLAVPLIGPSDADDQTSEGDLDVWVLDAASGAPLRQLRLASALDSDAIRFSALALDTARYRLDAATTAFGVRVSVSGSSGPNPFGQTSLRLFVDDGRTLRMVLPPLVVAESHGEWDTRCAGDFSDLQRTLAVAAASGAPAALLVRETGSSSRQWLEHDACKRASTATATAPRSDRLRAVGDQYPVPEALRPLQ